MVSSVIGSPSISASSSCRSFSAAREFAESLAGEIALAIIERRGEAVRQRNLDAAKFAIQIGVGRVVAQDVVTGNALLRLNDSRREIVVVEQSLASGVGGQSIQRVLRLLEIEWSSPARRRRCTCPGRRATPGSHRRWAHAATKPRASTGQNETPARMASLMVACNCA